MLSCELHPCPPQALTTHRRIKTEKLNRPGLGVPTYNSSTQEADVRLRLA